MHSLDSFLFFGLIIVFIGIGAFNAVRDKLRRKGRATQDHEVNSSDFSMSRAALSLFASTLSATLLIRNPASVYYLGAQLWIAVIALPFAIIFANFVTVPIFMRLNVKTSLAYLEERFGKLILAISLIFNIMETLINMSFWIAIPVRTLSSLLRVPSIWHYTIVSVVVTIYSALGGMRAIQRVDLIQLLVIGAANIAIISKGTATVGGFDMVYILNRDGGRSYFIWNMSPITEDETTLIILFNSFMWMMLRYSINQSVINRYSPASDLQTARLILWAQIPLMGFAHITSVALGLVIYGYYFGCDPLLTKRISANDDVVGLFFEDLMGHRPGLVGLFSGSLLSSMLSATSSQLNGLASIMNEHILKYGPVERLRKRLRIGKIAVRLSIPIISLALAFLIIQVDNNFNGYLATSTTALNTFIAPVMGVFLMGFFNRRATRIGALIGLFAGFAMGLTLLIFRGQYRYPPSSPNGASVSACMPYYCQVTSECANSTIPRESAINSTMTTDGKEAPPQLAYGLGGILSMVLTFVVGSLFSFCEKQTPEEQAKSRRLLAFYAEREKDD